MRERENITNNSKNVFFMTLKCFNLNMMLINLMLKWKGNK